MHDFPAGRLAVWATAWLSGRTSYDEALDALTGDSARRVSGLPGAGEAVPLGQSQRFAATLVEAGVPVELAVVPGVGHSIGILDEAMRARVAAFLHSHLG